MKKIKLIQQFQGNKIDNIIEVNDKIANDLINQKIAKKINIKNYLIKSKFGETKAFNNSPNTKKYEK